MMSADCFASQQQINEFCQLVEHEKSVAIDTEFYRQRTYWSKLCLVQMAVGENIILIDALDENIDLTSLKKIFLDESILKILHSSQQDIEIIYQLFQIIPNNVFDTQIAAAFCHYPLQVGYGSLVADLLGIELNKDSQFTNWQLRPLSDQQVDYAKNDVRYLEPLCVALDKRLKTLNHKNWFLDEMKLYLKEDNFSQRPDLYWQRFYFWEKSEDYINCFRRLSIWREEKAQERNIPRGQILKDGDMKKICLRSPKTKSHLKKVLFKISKSWKKYLIDDISEIVLSDDELVQPFDSLDKSKLSTELFDMVQCLLMITSKKLKIDEKFIATNDEIKEFILLHMEKKADDLKNTKLVSTWRYEAFGELVDALLKGDIVINMEKGELSLHPLNR